MIKKSILSIILLSSFFTFSCKKTYETPESSVVINEVLPVNSITMADQNGEYDDWIELFNLSASSVNLSGYYLSDDNKEPGKWKFPQGTTIAASGYLIIWADGDTTQTGLHTNFKLSSTGEDVILSNPEKTKIDKVEYPAQPLELSYSRVPNGTGEFKWHTPTFNKTNGSN
jgi:hypothetical protein